MFKEGKPGAKEAICLVTITITSNIFFSSPGLLADLLGNTAWYMTIISAVTAMVGFYFVYLLLNRFPGKNIIEIYEKVLGKFIGFCFSILFAIVFFMEASGMLSEFSYTLNAYFFPASSLTYLAALAAAGIIIQSFLGFETIAVFSKIISYFLLIGFVILLALPFKNYDPGRIFPILGYGIDITVIHGLMRSSSYGGVLILAIIAGNKYNAKLIKRAGYTSLLISGFLISSSLLLLTMALPHNVISEFTSPMYELSMKTGNEGLLIIIEPLLLIIWTLSSLIGVTALFYTSMAIYSKAFHIKDNRPLVLPCAALLLSGALAFGDITTLVTKYNHILQEYGWIILFVMPLITLIIAVLSDNREV